MKALCRLALFLVLAACGVPVLAMSCQVTPNPSDMNVIYGRWFTAVNTSGTLTVTCTRDPNADPSKTSIWIGMAQTTAGRTATLDTGGATLNYGIYHGGQTSGLWMDTGNVGPTSTQNGGVSAGINFRRGTTVSVTYTFYFTVPAPQLFRPAGVYVDSVPITVREGNDAGAIIGTGSLAVHISILKSCRFSTPPAPIAVNYVAFSQTPVTGSAQFGITCTKSTPYQLSLSPARSIVPVVGLAYGLSLGAPTGSITGTAIEQTYSVDISVDAGQPGSCSTSVCSGTDTAPVLTITY